MAAQPRGALGARALADLDTDSHALLTSLSDLAADDLALVAHALALVRVRLAQLAEISGNLADPLLVNAVHVESGRGVDLERDALGRLDQHGVAVAQRELKCRAARDHPVADPDDLQDILESGSAEEARVRALDTDT